MKRKFNKIKAVIPFSPEYRFSVTALENPDRKGMVTVYLKGAPEEVLKMCSQARSEGNVVSIV